MDPSPVSGPGGFGTTVGIALAVGLMNSPHELTNPEACAAAKDAPADVFQT